MSLFIRLPVTTNNPDLPTVALSDIRSLSYLLDVYVGAKAAFALRKLRRSYAGAAVRVRRSSDNLEADIGFAGDWLDTAALLAHVGSGDGLVSRWYDQSGKANDVLQATGDFQPKIVSAGALVTLSGKPSMSFDGVNDRLKFQTAGLSLICNVGYAYIAAVLRSSLTTGNQAAIMWPVPSSSARFGISHGDSAVNYLNTMLRRLDADVASIKSKASSVQGALPHLFEAYAAPSEGLIKSWQDLTAGETTALPSSGLIANTASTDAAIGCNPVSAGDANDANFWSGSISEVLIYTQKMDDVRANLAADVYSANFGA